ncbi:MAG: NADH-quinone oxidoreductase subunit J [Armatimonadota bacterium]|nr:NADH-quinone oxidoreductase subunit J [Armatimonadota bacterium]MDR5697038.1 NADH-quinone oxidoreductase subunit J [Armatimonadota bacterium]
MEVLLFTIASALSIAGGVGVIAARQPVHSALALLLVLGSLAALYLTLAAEFVAVLQVILYAGAIVVLFLFVIMLLHARSPEQQRPARAGPLAIPAAVFGVLLVAAISIAVLRDLGGAVAASPPEGFGTTEAVGRELFTRFVLPFEAAGILLLIGIVAGVVLGKAPARRSDGERGEP